jgi:hypothetical protein
MTLELITVSSDFSLPEQKELYFSHPYDRNFISQMSTVLKNGELPECINLTWLVWWFMTQKEYPKVNVYHDDDYGASEVHLEGRTLKILAHSDGTDEIHLPEDCNFKTVCDLLWITADYEPRAVWYEISNAMDVLAKDWTAKLTDKEVYSKIWGCERSDFINYHELFLKDQGCFQVSFASKPGSAEYNEVFASVMNDFILNVHKLQCQEWKHNSRYHYFITEVKPLQLQVLDCAFTLTIDFEYIVVLDWAYHHFLDHHLDRIASYSNPVWDLDELKTYARETWGVVAENREEILDKIKDELQGTNWVHNLTYENL